MHVYEMILESIKYLENNEDIIKYAVLHESILIEVQKLLNPDGQLLGYHYRLFQCTSSTSEMSSGLLHVNSKPLSSKEVNSLICHAISG